MVATIFFPILLLRFRECGDGGLMNRVSRTFHKHKNSIDRFLDSHQRVSYGIFSTLFKDLTRNSDAYCDIVASPIIF